jgi:tetratricopeptide (TPR) repeat protein
MSLDELSKSSPIEIATHGTAAQPGADILTDPSNLSAMRSLFRPTDSKVQSANGSVSFEPVQYSGQDQVQRQSALIGQMTEILKRDQGDHVKAAQDLISLQKADEKLYGRNSIESAQLFNIIGAQYEQAKQYGKAEDYYKQCAEVDTKVFGPDAFFTGVATQDIAHMEFLQGHYEQALPSYKSALAIYEKNKPESRPAVGKETIATLKDYADALDHLGRKDEAKKQRDRAVQISNALDQPGNNKL